MAKQKQLVPSIEEKLSICTHTSKSEKLASLAREFELGKSTVTDILREVNIVQRCVGLVL